MRVPNICGVVLSIALVACSSEAPIGVNDPDAHAVDAHAADAPPDAAPDAAACACDASSCGARVCGRSDCGFPCGECAPDEHCFTGTHCQAGPGPGAPCVDAFGDRVWEGDHGFRTCPTDPAAQQACTCSGAGADAWMDCAAACVAICAHVPADITCGVPGCHVGTEVCCIPSADTDHRACAAGSCASGNYTRACDGPEDCAGGLCCGADHPWTASCVPAATACAPLAQLCHSAADCGGAAAHCCPSAIVADVRTCSATPAAGCN